MARADPDRRVRKPIILLGSGRAGTTLLGSLFSKHPDVAYWVEPRPIWMYRHAYRSSHELGAEDLTPSIARYIDGRFATFTAKAGRTRFAEKTPSNCLRIPFIHALYPDCRMINIIRDGRAVVASTFKIQAGPPEMSRVRARIRETPLWEWPAYLPLFFQTVWRTKVLKKRSTFWGVRPAGWQQWLELPPPVMAARQWQTVVGASIRDGRALPAENYREIRFERLLEEPGPVVEELIEFADIASSKAMVDYAIETIDPSRSRQASAIPLPDDLREEIENHLQPLLDDLGY